MEGPLRGSVDVNPSFLRKMATSKAGVPNTSPFPPQNFPSPSFPLPNSALPNTQPRKNYSDSTSKPFCQYSNEPGLPSKFCH